MRNTTGTWWPSARRRFTTAKPSRSGSITSSTTRSGRNFSAERKGIGPVAGHLYVEALVAQGGRDEIGDVCLVVDDEDSGVGHMRMFASMLCPCCDKTERTSRTLALDQADPRPLPGWWPILHAWPRSAPGRWATAAGHGRGAAHDRSSVGCRHGGGRRGGGGWSGGGADRRPGSVRSRDVDDDDHGHDARAGSTRSAVTSDRSSAPARTCSMRARRRSTSRPTICSRS